MENLKGKLVEVAGEIVGLVIEDNKKTLLIREVHYSTGDDNVLLMEKAMFFDKDSVVNSYWIKFINTNLPFRSVNARGNIRDFTDM
ncbi:MAG: hypothetical protein NC489_31255 [Ruminococcus flavefaciens]|nr:hypothetical protein [Ruminococcus flavefaciens]